MTTDHERSDIPPDVDERRAYDLSMAHGAAIGVRPPHVWRPMLGASCPHGNYCPDGDDCPKLYR